MGARVGGWDGIVTDLREDYVLATCFIKPRNDWHQRVAEYCGNETDMQTLHLPQSDAVQTTASAGQLPGNCMRVTEVIIRH